MLYIHIHLSLSLYICILDAKWGLKPPTLLDHSTLRAKAQVLDLRAKAEDSEPKTLAKGLKINPQS